NSPRGRSGGLAPPGAHPRGGGPQGGARRRGRSGEPPPGRGDRLLPPPGEILARPRLQKLTRLEEEEKHHVGESLAQRGDRLGAELLSGELEAPHQLALVQVALRVEEDAA